MRVRAANRSASRIKGGLHAIIVICTQLTLNAFALPASAHLMPEQQGTLNVVSNGVFAVLALPLSAIDGVDDSGEGRVSTTELEGHLKEIRREVVSRVRIADGGKVGRVDFFQLNAEQDERDATSTAGNDHFVVLMKVSFDQAPTSLQLETDFWGENEGEQQLTIRATRNDDVDAVVLTPRRTVHSFFRSPQQVLGDYLTVGVEHILFGVDHLLFLLTIMVAGAGFRYWFSVVSCFTIAHGLTLTLALLGLIYVPASVVEPLIAASIVLMATLNLLDRAPRAHRQIPIVFACGLLHGFGFASSLADMGLDGENRVASIVGFNLGIELGQLIFLALLLGLTFVGRRVLEPLGRHLMLLTWPSRLAPARVVSWLAVLLGAFWFLDRLPPI